jgi:nitrate reductase NapE component
LRTVVAGLLLSAGHLLNAITLLAAIVYAFGCIVWMHAPVVDVVRLTATVALPLIGIAWLCRKAAHRLRRGPVAAAPSPVKTWLAVVIGVATLVAVGTVGRTGLGMWQCSVDRERNPAAYGPRSDGVNRVCEGDLARFDISFTSLERATRKLAFMPVDLAHTPFASLESLGGRDEYVNDVPSRLYRGFRLPDGHRLTLFEHDMSTDGVTTWRRPEDEPERINGLPARLGVFEDKAGTAVSHLSWVEGRRAYELWIDANVVREPLRERLFALAASLPKAVPGCPNEPPPKTMAFDADGNPVEEPMPKVLTVEQMDALEARGDPRRRPCK